MKSSSSQKIILVLGLFALLAASSPFTMAKVRPISLPKPRNEISFVKEIKAVASLNVQEVIKLPTAKESIHFQNGKLVQDVEFYTAPRCYLHLKKNGASIEKLEPGQRLQISKIDNVYSRGSVHVTFWFDRDPTFSDLACVTNSGHTLTIPELKDTLGNGFAVDFPDALESKALFNTFPKKNAPTLSEDSSSNYSTPSARTILSGSQ